MSKQHKEQITNKRKQQKTREKGSGAALEKGRQTTASGHAAPRRRERGSEVAEPEVRHAARPLPSKQGTERSSGAQPVTEDEAGIEKEGAPEAPCQGLCVTIVQPMQGLMHAKARWARAEEGRKTIREDTQGGGKPIVLVESLKRPPDAWICVPDVSEVRSGDRPKIQTGRAVH